MAGNSTIPFPAGAAGYVEDIGGGILMPTRKAHVGALGVDDSSGIFTIRGRDGLTNTTYLGAGTEIDPNGVVVVSGASTVYAVAINQASGGTLFVFLYDATAQQATNTKPLLNAGTLANNSTIIFTIGHPIHGLPFSTGVTLQLSTVALQFSATGSTSARGYVIHS